jgi:lysyl endopeptidase
VNPNHDLHTRILALFVLFAAPTAMAAVVTAVPPAEYHGSDTVQAKAVATFAAPDVPALRVDLAPVAPREELALRSANAATGVVTDKGRPLAVGFGRELGVAQRSIDLARLEWRTGADGNRYARIDIASPGAKAMRVALQLAAAPAGLAFHFSGVGEAAGNFATAGTTVAADGLFWSPTVTGEVLSIGVRAAPGAVLRNVSLVIPRVSHLLVDGADLNPMTNKAAKGVGAAGSCNIDVACVSPVTAAFTNMTRAVVKIGFVQDDGGSYVCSATLLNDSVQSFTPYIFTANHCINSARTARTLNTYWFFEAATCGSLTQAPSVHLTGGAALLGRSQDRDWALLRLNEGPPANAYFAAWRAEALVANATISSIHHPSGDLKKWSQGRYLRDTYVDFDEALGFFSDVTWTQGTTEGGSSGAPLLTFLASGGYYEVRGGLFGGAASCSNLAGVDQYSHLQAGLPLLRQYLTPNSANPGGQVAATEFYNKTLDHYFLSTNPVEIDNLDSGRTVGWDRTGLRFLAFNAPTAGANPVCRFYRAPAYGDSHFYSASPTECANTAAAHPVDWIYESPNVFYAYLPNTITGACPAATTPVYRFFNVGTTNHRYTAELTMRNTLATTPGWVAEGYGPGPYFPVMCAVAP